MFNSLNGTDYAIMGGKTLATMSKNRAVQNTSDVLSLGYNAFSLMQVQNELAQLQRQRSYAHAYGYRNYEIEQKASYYRSQATKHFVLGIVDAISLVCRNLPKN